MRDRKRGVAYAERETTRKWEEKNDDRKMGYRERSCRVKENVRGVEKVAS